MNKNRSKLFDIKHFPMDAGRFLCVPMYIWFNVRRRYLTPEAKKKFPAIRIKVGSNLVVGTNKPLNAFKLKEKRAK